MDLERTGSMSETDGRLCSSSAAQIFVPDAVATPTFVGYAVTVFRPDQIPQSRTVIKRYSSMRRAHRKVTGDVPGACMHGVGGEAAWSFRAVQGRHAHHTTV